MLVSIENKFNVKPLYKNPAGRSDASCREGKTAIFVIVLILIFITVFPVTVSFAKTHPLEGKKILLLNSYHQAYPWTEWITEGVKSAFEPYALDVRLNIEYMDAKRYRDQEHLDNMLDLYKYKMPRRGYDVLIISDNAAFEFALEYRDELWPGIPLVFCGVESFTDYMLEDYGNITGIAEDEYTEGTIRLALSLHPRTKQILVVSSGVSLWTISWQEHLENLAGKLGNRVDLVSCALTDFTVEEVLEKIESLGDDSVVLLVNFLETYRDRYPQPFEQGAEMIKSRCSVPIYVTSQYWFDTGIAVGGSIRSGQVQGSTAADMALRILYGENADSIPTIYSTPDVYMFNYPELKRFDIPVSALPENSVIVNEPTSFYYQYKKRIWLAVLMVSGLILTAFLLSVNIIRRKIVERKLLNYQGRLKSLALELSLIEDRQRWRIATDLHDHISQSLIISKLSVETLRQSASSKELIGGLTELCDSLDQTIQATRSLTFDLGSPILYELGFEAAVGEWLGEQVERKHGISCEFSGVGRPIALSDDIAVILFRMVRELLINVVKHSHASRVKVVTNKVDSEIHVSVEDDGVGFEPPQIASMPTKAGGFGLFSIHERLEQLTGRLEINSSPGQGTKIKIIAPVS